MIAEEKFWGRVDRGDDESCWPWTGSRSDGYGTVYVMGKVRKAHRVAWALAHGVMPPSSLCVCHHCDNPPCCNPRHLFLGTKAANNEDKKRKGRAPDVHGAANPNARLSDADVAHIRELWEAGMSQTAIGHRYGVAQSWVSQLVRGRRRRIAEI